MSSFQNVVKGRSKKVKLPDAVALQNKQAEVTCIPARLKLILQPVAIK